MNVPFLKKQFTSMFMRRITLFRIYVTYRSSEDILLYIKDKRRQMCVIVFQRATRDKGDRVFEGAKKAFYKLRPPPTLFPVHVKFLKFTL